MNNQLVLQNRECKMLHSFLREKKILLYCVLMFAPLRNDPTHATKKLLQHLAVLVVRALEANETPLMPPFNTTSNNQTP